jgi:hypothetical protein
MRGYVALLGLACVWTVASADRGRTDPSTDLLWSPWSYAEPSFAKESSPETAGIPVWISSDRYAAYFGLPGSEWDLAVVCRPERGVLEFTALGVETPPIAASETISIRGVSEQARVVFDPDGMGSVTSELPARGPVVRALASSGGILRFSGTHGQPAKLRVPPIVTKVAAACLSSETTERYTAPHDPVAVPMRPAC